MRLSPPPFWHRRTAVVIGAALVVSAATVAATPARAVTRGDALQSAAAYAKRAGYHVGIAVLDTKTGALRGSGDWHGIFASESLIKVFIATRLLVQHRMSGSNERRAWKMITQSDDAIASSFYGSVGGDNLVNWMKRRYHVPDLGYPPSQPGWWGNTHLRPAGLVKLYAKLKRDRTVAPWLLNAMHHARPYGSDGTYQFFGIPSATKGFAVKQGWGNDYEIGSSADFNTTGFVNNYRYTVAILARGPSSSYGSAIGNLLTQVARRVLPGGAYPDPIPQMHSVSPLSSSTTGGRRVTITGANLTHVTAVRFGTTAGTNLQVLSPTKLRVTTPSYQRSYVYVRVFTNHGQTARVKSARFLFERPPAIGGMTAHSGRTAGGGTVYLSGKAFVRPVRVLFGTTPAASVARVSRHKVRVTVPKHDAGTVNARVITGYGKSAMIAADRYTFVAAPTIKSISPPQGSASGGTTVTITGTSFAQRGLHVLFGGTPASQVHRTSATKLTAVAPTGHPGVVDVVVRTSFGQATDPHAYTYTP
jgi:hypothetical protein